MQAIRGNIAIENVHQQPQQNALHLNNAIHNQDVTSIPQDVLVCLVSVGMVLGTYISSFLIDKNGTCHLAVRFFFHFNALFLARAFVLPVIFFAMNKHARRHVKTTFWNEWAPDFIRNYNLNRVVEIGLTNYSSVPYTSTSKCIASTSNLNPTNAVLPGQTLITNESTQTTESIAPKPNTTFDNVTPSYVPIPSTSKCPLGLGTTYIIPHSPDLPGQIPISNRPETTESTE